ncbi:(p)ppGpp synthetase [Tamlana sp. 2201CG12-4]|uniref:GTP pyrophosphokinase n=1 Tax=Tamlana sp. 2201CG12-4 TaxID=3112582 RepID=UPI002DBD3427|nr:(p)ppGpp synthetase [Tamlana sp. 2201CG12-4]MEC3905750.1 (p)ppGpp synthetase [Tamlana sp. 2201CG12-4]
MGNQIVESYIENKSIYEVLAIKVKDLLEELINDEGINVHHITCRAKDVEKLDGKLKRKNNKYSNIEEITDLAGIRIITFFEDDVDKIADIIEREYEVDRKNSIDKRALESEKFGYMSLHYVASLTKQRLRLTENKKFKGKKFEIQVRSILQHSWAEIEHDIGYKGEFAIPSFAKRSFSRIAALLEIADIEFIRLRNQLQEYGENVSENLDKNSESILLDKISLLELVKSNPDIDDIEKSVAKQLNWSYDKSFSFSDNLVEHNLKRISKNPELNITNIKQIQINLKKYKKEIIKSAVSNEEKATEGKSIGLVNGAAISYLIEFLEK